jgi:hypothetical protein
VSAPVQEFIMTKFSRTFPLFSPFLRRVLGPDTPDTQVLQPAEIEAVSPPIYLQDMLERVTATVKNNDLSYYLRSATETAVTHVPVIRYTYRNALVRRRGFSTKRTKKSYYKANGLSDFLTPVTEIKTLRYCYNSVIYNYFGHWLTDATTSAFIDSDRGDLWMPPIEGSAHARDYLDALDLKIIESQLVHAAELIDYQDYGQGSHKQQRYEQIFQKLLARYGSDEPSSCVYIRRGRTGAPRWIANEDALIDALVSRNWRILDIATATVADMQRVLLRASVVVSIEGSQLDHAILSIPKGSAMVILEPQDRFLLRFVGLCRARGVRPGFVVLNGSLANGYTVDLDELLRTVDLTAASAGSPTFHQ